MHRPPAARVGTARDLLAFVDRRYPGARSEILSEFPEVSRHLLETLPGSSWLAIEHDHLVVENACRVLGTEEAIQCWRRSVRSAFDRPLLRSFFHAGFRLFGMSPARLVGVLPKAWELFYRDFCNPVIRDRDEYSLTLVFDDVATAARRHPSYFHSWHGLCLGILDLAEAPGQIDFGIEIGADRAIAVFEWQ